MKILAVGAHPDDLEILCGGTLVRFVQEEHEVVMCHASTGNRGSYIHSSAEIARIRDREAFRAAEIAGALSQTLGLSDCEIESADPRQRDLVIDLVREVRPDLIITHYPDDYMSDHNEISKLVFKASFHATLPLYETGKPHHELVTPIYYMDTLMGIAFQPTEFVDVSAVLDTKTAMLEAHESQVTWLRDHDGVDVVEQMKTMTRFRGQQCGVAYAEGFTPSQAWLRMRPHRLLP
jgi:LmbE family N-acetylglucosaminyl deacetylase